MGASRRLANKMSSLQISRAGMEPAVVPMSAQRLVRFYSSEGLGGHATHV